MNKLISRTLSEVHLKVESRRHEINVTKDDSSFQVVESWNPYNCNKRETEKYPRCSTVFEGEIRMANVLIQGNCLGKACVSFGLCDKAWTTSKSS